MTTQLILTAVAEDKPGLVKSLSELVLAHDGNWMDSSMIRLGGEFAGIVQVAIPDDKLTAFETAMEALGNTGIALTLRKAHDARPAEGRVAQLSLTGIDHPGIIRDISAALAASGVNIDELQSVLGPGSMTGEQMFSATARIVIPAGLSRGDLRDNLERLAQDIIVEIDLSPDGEA